MVSKRDWKRFIWRRLNGAAGRINELLLLRSTRQYGLNLKKRDTTIVLSLASYKKRYDALTICLRSLLWQTIKPDKIIVWLDEDKEDNQPTAAMRELEKFGVEYRFTFDGLRPHKKYFYAMRAFPDSIIITVDDDMIYPKTLISSLIAAHQRYPGAMCARRVHKMIVNEEGRLAPYQEWEHEYTKSRRPSYDLCATGVGGCLYPPHILPEETFDMKRIKELCIGADDIWLKFMELLADIPVVWVPCLCIIPRTIAGSQQTALMIDNVSGGANDRYIQHLVQHFPKAYDRLLEKIDRI